MLWNAKEIGLYLKEKAYIDTVIVPILPISFTDRTKQEAEQAEFITLLTNLLEKQFKGRMLLVPPFTYISGKGKGETEKLQEWIEEFKENQFEHVFCLTSDIEWKEFEQDLGGNLIWMPSIPLEHMEEKYKRKIIDDQVNQLVKLIVQKWQTN
ncbi:YpiF family protein [Jeotgalibacillus sp. ET6]|uniref:YpiF family protein n=1 Tax=Jeotgalibacillus sp. ET6 TaxID=3037260 RepID=UPI00241870E6|nr:YpiF family protein [Jeotgalibacillus sp. ET6]MDG5470637.1 YpiF family protein [Jeotgalibacillus sp. ET6]